MGIELERHYRSGLMTEGKGIPPMLRTNFWQGVRQEGFDVNHMTMATLRAITQRFAGELLVAVAIV